MISFSRPPACDRLREIHPEVLIAPKAFRGPLVEGSRAVRAAIGCHVGRSRERVVHRRGPASLAHRWQTENQLDNRRTPDAVERVIDGGSLRERAGDKQHDRCESTVGSV